MLNNYLLLISCSQRKVESPEPLMAIDRYDGPTYRTLRKAIDADRIPENLHVLIISAKHGLIPWQQSIEPYDQCMTPERADVLRPGIQRELIEVLSEKRYAEVFMNLGKTYMRTLEGFHWGLHTTLEASGGIGLKTSQMKAWLHRCAHRTAKEYADHKQVRCQGAWLRT